MFTSHFLLMNMHNIMQVSAVHQIERLLASINYHIYRITLSRGFLPDPRGLRAGAPKRACRVHTTTTTCTARASL